MYYQKLTDIVRIIRVSYLSNVYDAENNFPHGPLIQNYPKTSTQNDYRNLLISLFLKILLGHLISNLRIFGADDEFLRICWWKGEMLGAL